MKTLKKENCYLSKQTAFIDACRFENNTFYMDIMIEKEFYEKVQATDQIPAGFKINPAGNYLTASIAQSELNSTINDSDNQLELSYQMLIGKENLGRRIRIYPAYQVQFRCLYSLQTSTNPRDLEVENPTLKDSRSIVGSLGYEMEILTPQLKLGTRVRFRIKPIVPDFVYNRIAHCYVTNGNTGNVL